MLGDKDRQCELGVDTGSKKKKNLFQIYTQHNRQGIKRMKRGCSSLLKKQEDEEVREKCVYRVGKK